MSSLTNKTVNFGNTYTCYTDGSFKYRNIKKVQTNMYDHGIGVIFNELNVNLVMKLLCNGNETNNDTEQISILHAILFQVYHILFPSLPFNEIINIVCSQFNNLILSDTKLNIGHTIIIYTDSLSTIRDLKSKNKNNKSILKYTGLLQKIISTYAQNNIFIKIKYVKAHADNHFNNLADSLSKQARVLKHNFPIINTLT